nr:PREDICTED: EF-hand calcium-binding domain-containing protein 7 isoform X2 [Latimeria chalumnae]|eukprot:XP_014344367.1 PREDICTED: EF-hand calcium-binding domain-containing protein 7 isoform X2 [Latimeria chalumnae]
MSSYHGSIVSLISHKSTDSESKKKRHTEEEIFYMTCRAAYLAVFRSSLENITSKKQLCLVLQQAGRNPSQKTLDKCWTPKTTKLNFDDFCDILKKENSTTERELLSAFQKIDVNNDGHITHDELYNVLTTQGEKMSVNEVKSIIQLADVNNDGKLDYNEFCKLFMTTTEHCQRAALEKLETDTKLRRQQFGSQTEGFPSHSQSSPSKQLEGSSWKLETETTPRKADGRPSSRPSSARSRRASVSSTFSMGASSRSMKLTEPKAIKDWQYIHSKGCFFLEEDGGIMSHQYRLYLPQKSAVYLSIKPLNLSQDEEKPSPWMSMDTALYVLKENEHSEDMELEFFTELRDKEKFGWKGELNAGVYRLLPFTTGCRLKKKRKQNIREAKLVYRDDSGELALTKEFRTALSDVFEVIDLDGNGLLSLEEYNFFELRTSGEKCDEDAWTVCKENFDTKKNELTRQGFMDLNLMEANDREGDPSDLWITLQSMGYNKALEMTEACPFIVEVFAKECKAKLKTVNLEQDCKLLNTAICKSVISKGEAKVIKGHDNVIIYTYKSDTRISSVIENKVCQHVMPMNERQDWIYNCIDCILTQATAK